jgi:nicotinamide riboside kinase
MSDRPVVSHKLVLLGDTSVGKSCLVVRFCRCASASKPRAAVRRGHSIFDRWALCKLTSHPLSPQGRVL